MSLSDLGPDHPIAIALSLLLTKTLWLMCEMEKVVRHMRATHRLCVDTWGDHHPLTLDVTETLGSALSIQGKYTESNALHVANLEKMKRLYGDKHQRLLKLRETLRESSTGAWNTTKQAGYSRFSRKA